MIIILLSLLAIFFYFLEGKRDASFYSVNVNSPTPVKENLHWLFFSTRFIVLWLMFVVTTYAYPNQLRLSDLWNLLPRIPIKSSIFLISLALIFSFVHNGVYYETRHKLDKNIYPKGFRDDSTSSTATIEMNFKMRTTLAVIGVLGVIMAYSIW